MLKEATRKPKSVLFCEIKEQGSLKKIKEGKYIYKEDEGSFYQTRIKFITNADRRPVVGDFIIKASDENIYHCPKKNFNDMYSVNQILLR